MHMVVTDNFFSRPSIEMNTGDTSKLMHQLKHNWFPGKQLGVQSLGLIVLKRHIVEEADKCYKGE